MSNPIQGLSNLFVIENSDSNGGVLGGTGKELVVEKTAVTLASNAAADVATRFAVGQKVYVIPAYEVVVAADGNLDLDFTAFPDTSVQVLVLGKESQLAGTD